MAINVKDFLNLPETKALHDKMDRCPGRMFANEFNQNPFRAIHYNPNLLYSPADGVVLYTMSCVEPDEFLEIKGKKFTLKDMLHNKDYDTPSLVIGVFMTALSIHVNRMPCNALVTDVRATPNIFTRNSSMLMIENGLFEKYTYDENDLAYLFSNERKITDAYNQQNRIKFHITQIADRDVNCVINWSSRKYFSQGERFGIITFGSQCDLIIELDNHNKYKILVKPLDYVYAGLDPLVKIVGK